MKIAVVSEAAFGEAVATIVSSCFPIHIFRVPPARNKPPRAWHHGYFVSSWGNFLDIPQGGAVIRYVGDIIGFVSILIQYLFVMLTMDCCRRSGAAMDAFFS